ncbi:MAG TPA: hypothetical protein VIL63_09680 [Terriglobales bacterium]
MENWKRALTAAAAGVSAICFIKGKPTTGLLFAGVSLATLASEYPEEFRKIRDNVPAYVNRGMKLLDTVTRVGEHMAQNAQGRGREWYEVLLDGARTVAINARRA